MKEAVLSWGDRKGKYCPSVVAKFGDESCPRILPRKFSMPMADNADEAGDV